MSEAGSGSEASDAPGVTGMRLTSVHEGGAADGMGAATSWRQMTAVMAPLMGSLSVVRGSVVQWSWTSSPTRVAAVKPAAMTAGRLSVGGSGGPGLAHPARRMMARVPPTAVWRKRPTSGAEALFLAGPMWHGWKPCP